MRCNPIETVSVRNLLAFFLAIGILISLTSGLVHGDDSFPYSAQVVTAGTPVRSGPGKSHYLTETLAEGEQVEVYRQESNGWCAIRPTEESFSWVFARHVEKVGASVGKINKPEVAARVGSLLSKQRDAVQVRLKKNELVQILEETIQEEESWYKIAPPAGEFRWIHHNNLKPQKPTSPTPSLTSPSPPPITPIPQDLEKQASNLELQLSHTVADSPTSWKIEPLLQEAEALLSQAKSEGDRKRVRGILKKLDHFAAIQRRYLQSGITPPENTRYDVVGILRPVVSRRPNAPRFAVVDDRGQIVSFVTPTPDIDLQSYLGRKIGIVGTRGYMPEFQRAHVMAGQIAPLNGRILR